MSITFYHYQIISLTRSIIIQISLAMLQSKLDNKLFIMDAMTNSIEVLVHFIIAGS